MRFRKYILPVLLFLGVFGVLVDPAYAVYVERPNCADLSPTIAHAHLYTCKQTTTTDGRSAGHIYNWNGAAWVDIDTDIIGGSDDDQTAAEVPFAPAGSIAATNVQAAIEEVASEAGGGSFSGDAEDVTFAPAGNIAATDVQAALEELDTEKAAVGHTQAATTVTVTPTGLIASTNVQTALVELDTEKSPTGHNHDGIYKPAGDDAADLNYTPADNADWGTDPTNAAEALDQVALRVTDIEADNATQTELDAHVNGSPAHAGTAVTNTPAGNIAATTVQAAINELDTEKATAVSVSDHLADTVDAHDASAVSVAPSGNIAATDVQAALVELDTEKQGIDSDLTALGNNSTNGFWARTSAGLGAARTITPGSSRLTISNGDGIAGNPTLDVDQAALTLQSMGGAVVDSQVPNLNTLSTGLTASRCVQTDASGLLSSTAGACGAGGGATAFGDLTGTATDAQIPNDITINPPGADGEVTFNDGGARAGDAGLKYDKDTDELTVAGSVNTGGDCTSEFCIRHNVPALTADRDIDWPDADGDIVLDSTTDTLTNKSMSGSSNTFTNLPVSSVVNALKDDGKNITILDPTTSETNKVQIQFASAVTLQEVGCSTLPATSTVTIQLDKRSETTPNTAGTDALSSTLVCDDNRQETSLFASAGVSATEVLNLQITAVANSPTAVRIHIIPRKN